MKYRSLQVRCGPMQSRRVAASGSAAGPRSLEVDDEMAPSAAAAADEVLQHLFRLVDEEAAAESASFAADWAGSGAAGDRKVNGF